MFGRLVKSVKVESERNDRVDGPDGKVYADVQSDGRDLFHFLWLSLTRHDCKRRAPYHAPVKLCLSRMKVSTRLSRRVVCSSARELGVI